MKTNYFYCVMSADKWGPVWGVGITEIGAKREATKYGFDHKKGKVFSITEKSFKRIRAGDPDAVEFA